jgi:hypothetical protein
MGSQRERNPLLPTLGQRRGRVFFNSPEPLAPSRDTNNAVDVYEFDGERTALISTGKGTGGRVAHMSVDGRDVFFTTRDQLLAIDKDSAVDIYDARIGGGFPAQNQLPPSTACAGEDCSGAGTPPAQIPPIGSEGTKGRGNTSARQGRKCGKNRILRKIRGKKRCVKKQKHRTNNDRRQGR